jgi:hypothetical protein
MASGFIYLIILGMWVAYFVPRWISNHEKNSAKKVEKFNSAMRSVTQMDARRAQSEDKLAKQAQIRNRRIIFSSLLAILIGNSVSVGLKFVAAPILAIPASALLIYTIHVRRQVVASQIKQRRLNALERISAAAVISEPTRQIKISSREDFEESYKEHWIPLLERADSAGVVIIPKGEKRDSWQPRQVPKPTYVDAPKAVVPKRIIDLTVPGAWIESEKIAAEDLIMKDEFFDQTLFDKSAEDRAVNE